MLKKILLLLLISSVALSGFAQKSKRKSPPKAPKSEYFVMLINGDSIPADRYCPKDTITFDFKTLNQDIEIINYCWWDNFTYTGDCDITPITLAFPNVNNYRVTLDIKFEIPTDSVPYIDSVLLVTEINIDFIRTILDTTVCQGRDITVPTNTHGNITYTDVQGDLFSPWDTLQSVSGCDSLVRWHIIIEPYIIEEYEISSCDSVIWGEIIVKRPPGFKGDYTTDPPLERFFPAYNPANSCDTMKYLKVTIIDTAQLSIVFDQKAFCDGDDMGGDIGLETNFTAFNWKYFDKDSTFTVYERSIYIEDPGYYFVLAYMDTSLYDTLKDLRIVNCYMSADTMVEDCPLVFPNVITPGNDSYNDVLGIKKLNTARENVLTIYDRWGKSVFYQKNYKCVFKNGSYHNTEDAFSGISRGGQKLPDGTYYYSFKYASIPKNKTYSGIIMILREQ